MEIFLGYFSEMYFGQSKCVCLIWQSKKAGNMFTFTTEFKKDSPMVAESCISINDMYNTLKRQNKTDAQFYRMIVYKYSEI